MKKDQRKTILLLENKSFTDTSMAYMADLNSFSPIRYEDRHLPSNNNEPRGILTNKTNTTSTNQYQSQKQNPTLATQPEAALINQYQPPKYNHPTPSSQPPPPTATVNQKLVRPRSASVQSQKSVGDATDDERNQNPLLREHPRKTIVAFGRTTKVDETIKNIRPTTLPYKPPVGSTKDILDLRKIVEHQAIQLQSQQDEIQQLLATIEGQQEKYRFLLDSNSKLWARFDKLEKQISTNNSNANYNHIMLKEKAKEEAVIHSNIDKHVPKDSIAVKKYKEKAETEKPQRNSKNNNNNEERQIVPAQSIKLASEIDAVSAVERYLYANPNRAKDIEKIAKGLQKKHRKSDTDESEHDKKKMDNGRGDHRRGHHHHHKNDKNDIVEKITLERKIYKRHNIHDYLSSTIDDSLHKLGISTIQDRKQNHHHRQNRRRSPTTPTIHEVTSSEASSTSFESDDFVEEPHHHRQSPERPLRRQNVRRYDSDRENRRLSPTVEATNMPDQFDDDDDLSSDNETPKPQPRRERRQRVAERLQNRRH